MSKEWNLEFPLTEGQVRELHCGDVVYLSGVIYTMRDMGHRRAVDMLNRCEKLPFDLAAGAIWHCAPIVRKLSDGKWEAISAGSTTSSRFTYLGSDLLRLLNVRCTIGKGTMLETAVDTMQTVGSCFLNATGGCAALYAEKIQEVVDVFWTDLGLPEATWVLRVKDLGPLIVGIDSHGNSLYSQVGAAMKTRIKDALEKSGIEQTHNFSYLPKRVPGKASVG
jgi:fumarate hydratase subunit beta